MLILAARNQVGLTAREIEYCVKAWELLCGTRKRGLITLDASNHSSRTRFVQNYNVVLLGADVKPGGGIGANSKMSILACLAHELAHMERYELGFDRPITLPDVLLDEAETSLHASYNPVLGSKDRRDLIEDAQERIVQWLLAQP